MSANSAAPKRSTVILAVLVLVVLVAGIVVTRFVAKPSSRAASAEAAASDTSPRPDAHTSGTATGPGELEVEFTRDESGAVDAAVAYSTASQRWLYFTDDEIRAAVAEIATPVAAPRMADEIVIDVSTARDQLAASSGPVWWLVRPLAWRVEDHDPDQARVSVWTVTILSAAEVAAPQSEFLTVTLDLAWVDGGWRVDGVRDAPGPTPMTGPHDQPWDAEPFDDFLDGFTRLDGEPVR